MSSVVVTVGPDHTLREAARRMSERGVGAAVVIGDDAGLGPGIVTERDILRSAGAGDLLDEQRVRDHLTADVVYATPEWSLEQAASEMVRGGFRHIIVLDSGSGSGSGSASGSVSGEVCGILSMRDIVRCWTQDGAVCDVPAGAA